MSFRDFRFALAAFPAAVLIVSPLANAALPPYRPVITLPQGYSPITDPELAGSNYVYGRPNAGTHTFAALQFMIMPASDVHADPNAATGRTDVLDALSSLIEHQHTDYIRGDYYGFDGAQDGYTCLDWRGTVHGNDFAGFLCATFRGEDLFVVEGQDLAAQALQSLPDLKASLKAATYEKN